MCLITCAPSWAACIALLHERHIGFMRAFVGWLDCMHALHGRVHVITLLASYTELSVWPGQRSPWLDLRNFLNTYIINTRNLLVWDHWRESRCRFIVCV